MPWLVDDTTIEALQRRVMGVTRDRMLREMAEAIEVLTAECPIVLVIEDLHWSDVSTIDLIASLARRREPARLLLLATYRPAEIMLHAHPLQTVKQELGVHGQCHELALPVLTEVEVEAYLDVRFPGVMFPPEMTQFLHQRTDGNPLFVASVVDYWQGQGLPMETERPVPLLEWLGGVTAEVPDTLRKLIEQQLGQLGRDDQRLLEAASVAGKEFGTAVVAAAVDQTTEHVETCLEALARRGQFVRAHGVAAWPDGTLASRYTFIHDLYRTALYDRVPAGQRAQWHRHIGMRLEAGYESRAPGLATELAEHFARGRDTERALQYLQCAGENALRRSAYHEAIVHLTRSLALLPDLPVTVEHHRTHLELSVYDTGVICRAFAAHNLWYLGYPDQAARRTHEALVLAQELGHPYTTAGTLGLAAVWATLRGEWQRAQETAEAVITLSHEHGFPYFAAWGTILRGSALSAQGQHEAGIAQLRQGLEAYHATGAAVLHTCWAGLLVEALKRARASEEGLCVLDDALATIPSSGERRSEAELYRLRGELLQHLQGHTQHTGLTPEVCFQRAIDIARRQQAKGLELRAAMSLSRLWRQQGKHLTAQQLLRDTLVWFSEGFDTVDLQDAQALLDELA